MFPDDIQQNKIRRIFLSKCGILVGGQTSSAEVPVGIFKGKKSSYRNNTSFHNRSFVAKFLQITFQSWNALTYIFVKIQNQRVKSGEICIL